MEVALGSSEESVRRVTQKLETREQECATHRRELEATTRALAALRKGSETRMAVLEKAQNQAGTESERRAGTIRQDLQTAQDQIKTLEAGQQALTEDLVACEQELKALRKPPTPPPSGDLPANPPASPP